MEVEKVESSVKLDEIEWRAKGIVADVLGCSSDAIDIEKTATELGCDSVAATICTFRIFSTFGIEIPVETLLSERVSLRELAREIDAAVRRGRPTIDNASLCAPRSP